MVNTQHRRRAFTLIELLIVIVIIGLLTGLATTSYISAQKNARDNTRKTGVASIANAVEAYYQTKRNFPGLIGNEGAANIPQQSQRANWAGCLALDPGNTSVLYYSYPTKPASVGGANDTAACNERTAATGFPAPSSEAQYGAYPNWIPGLAPYLNPTPVETRYQNATGNIQTLDNPSSGAFTAQSDDVLGIGVAQSFVYRHLDGGYMVYARLESNTTDIPVSTPMTDRPKYSNGNGVTAYSNKVFMIRK